MKLLFSIFPRIPLISIPYYTRNIPFYTFLYLFIPFYTFLYLFIPDYTLVYTINIDNIN